MTKLLIAFVLAVAALGQERQAAVMAQPFTAITTAQASGVLNNIGQMVHLLVVRFPAEGATVSGLQVRLEASYDNVGYFPIGADILSAPRLPAAGAPFNVYAYARTYGVFPYLRVNSLNATGGPLMTVNYTGSLYPTTPTLALLADRWAF
jgi:hypothetical protein